MTELEELRLAYAECNRQRNELLAKLKHQARQESVGYVYSVHGERIKNACIESDVPNGTPVYILPQRKPWVGLTDDDLDDIATAAKRGNLHDLRLAIEAKLKEKNNG